MKIVFSNYDDVQNPYYAGGGARAIHEVAKRLAKGHDVTVVTERFPGSKNEIVDKVVYQRIGPFFLGPRLGQLVFQFLLNFHVTRASFDVWIENFTPPFSTAFLQLFTKKPVIGLTQLLAADSMARKYNLPFEILERIGLKTYRYVIATTPYIKRKILGINKSCFVRVIPNGVYSRGGVFNGKSGHILFLGRLDVEQKGLDMLVDAYELVSSQINLPLVIAGAGLPQDRLKLKKQIKKHRLESRIRVVGHVEGKEKEELLASAAFIVLPSRFEGFGLVALEAFAFGKPVLTFNIDELSWIPKTSSVKVVPFSVKDLARGIHTLSTNANLRLKKSHGVASLLKKYDWDHITREYERYLRCVVERKHIL